MFDMIFRPLAALSLALALGACVPSPALIEAGLAKPPEPVLVPDAYVARADNGIAIPALPVAEIPAQFQRQTVYFPNEESTGTIIINPGQRLLHFITGPDQAIRYGIAVGRDGFQWSGEAVVAERKTWPTWTPPPEMIDRHPELAKWEKGQPGGPTNPLGARAIYLTSNGVDYGYRIHGTPEWRSIGSNASSGCIRMINQDVIDLYSRVTPGSKVVVLNADGSRPTKLKLPPPAPKKPKPAEELPAPATIIIQKPAVMPLPVITGPQPVAAPAALPAAETATTCLVPLADGSCPKP